MLQGKSATRALRDGFGFWVKQFLVLDGGEGVSFLQWVLFTAIAITSVSQAECDGFGSGGFHQSLL